MTLSVVVLAAGQGKRMRSALPKVLHQLAGQSLLGHVLAAAGALQADRRIVVYGHGGDQVRQALSDRTDIDWVEQAERLGTGHAVMQALPNIESGSTVLVLYGDVPLIEVDALKALIGCAERGNLGLLTIELPNPTGYGRIIRDAQQQIQCIVEERDANVDQRLIREVNTGVMAVSERHLRPWLAQLTNDNAQGEYYLTDIIALAVRQDVTVETVSAGQPETVLGVNDRRQLAMLERYYQRRIADRLMDDGVTLIDPDRIDVRGTLVTGRDVIIDVNAVFEGDVTLGDGVRIEANCVIRNTVIGDNSEILSHSLLEEAVVGRHAQIGPFARLRPGTRLADQTKIGNFVEVKKATIGTGSKVNHLSYIGDAEIGADVNVGAGTITCNYDGANKHKTVLEDRVFVGSNTALVAPVTVGTGATIGAGSTVVKDVEAGHLALTRSAQKSVSNWKRPLKKK